MVITYRGTNYVTGFHILDDELHPHNKFHPVSKILNGHYGRYPRMFANNFQLYYPKLSHEHKFYVKLIAGYFTTSG